MRTFIAIELPETIRSSLSKLQESLKETGSDVKWVEPHNIHLTLKFLGEINEAKLEQVNAILDTIAETNSSFCLRISELGAFPNIDCPKIIWVGIDKGGAETKKIAAFLEEKLSLIGFPKESREFSTHITIGRIRSGKNRLKLVNDLDVKKEDFTGRNLETTVTKITLFKSSLSPKGPTYTTLKEASLKTA